MRDDMSAEIKRQTKIIYKEANNVMPEWTERCEKHGGGVVGYLPSMAVSTLGR
jgi:hypothetical protein